ncbi:hypothetical protein [Solidesulfovibrio sp.]
MKHTIIRVLAALAVLALPVQSMAAEGMMTLAQQGQYPGSQSQQPGQPPYGTQGQQPGQPQYGTQGQQQRPPSGSQGQQGGYQQPRPPMNQPPVAVTPPPPPRQPQQPGYDNRNRSSNRQYKAVARCNQRQASCARNCNRNYHGRARTNCNIQCNAVFVNCTTRATRGRY